MSEILAIALLAAMQAALPSAGAQDDEEQGPFAKAVAEAQQRTVKIYGGSIGRTPGYATGILVSADGQLLTAQGAFLATENLRVVLADGSMHPAKVLRRSQKLQVALLKIEASTPDYFRLEKPTHADAGDWVLAVSNAFKVAEGEEPLSVNIGVLSARMPLDARRGFQDFPYEGDVYLYDAITSNPGAAGGAIVTTDGKLLGMIGKVIEGKTTNTRLNYAVPADLLAPFVRGEDEAPTPPNLAVTNQPVDLGIRLFALGGRKSPAYIDRVIPNSPAAKAGLRGDDLIISIAGQAVRDASDFRRIVPMLQPRQEVIVEIKRKDQVLTVRVISGETQ